MTANLTAFLATVRHSEGTDQYPDPYRVCFEGKHTIVNMSNHPAVTGEWLGEPLDFLGPEYVGKISDAAGAYQIIKPTWLDCMHSLNLPDFEPSSQDACAIELIRRAGALDLVNAGQFSAAIGLCRGIWASLPGGTSGQPEQRAAVLLAFYQASGGSLS